MRKLFILTTLGILILGGTILLFASNRNNTVKTMTTSSIYDINVTDIEGNDVNLGKYKDNVVMFVNTASKCGYTPQYKGLQAIYDKYKDQGFVILGFPANNFGGQEPGSNEEIKEFCELRYKVKFPMFAKISVVGEDKHPLYQFLTKAETNPEFSGEIPWNFTKFLADKDGNLIARFPSKAKPESEEVTSAIEAALASKKKAATTTK